jgi:hypothetical protein
MTHLHTDHADGLHHFPQSEILVSRKEYKLASGFMGRLRGYLPNHPSHDPASIKRLATRQLVFPEPPPLLQDAA